MISHLLSKAKKKGIIKTELLLFCGKNMLNFPVATDIIS